MEASVVAGRTERGRDPASGLIAYGEPAIERGSVDTEPLGIGKCRRNHWCTGVDGGAILIDVGVIEIHRVRESAVEERGVERTVCMCLSDNGSPAARIEVVDRVGDRTGVFGVMTRRMR